MHEQNIGNFVNLVGVNNFFVVIDIAPEQSDMS